MRFFSFFVVVFFKVEHRKASDADLQTNRDASDAESPEEILTRLTNFSKNLNEYMQRLSLAGIPAAEAATRVHVQAALAELAQKALAHLERIKLMKEDVEKKIELTMTEMEEVVKDKTAEGGGNGGSGFKDPGTEPTPEREGKHTSEIEGGNGAGSEGAAKSDFGQLKENLENNEAAFNSIADIYNKAEAQVQDYLFQHWGGKTVDVLEQLRATTIEEIQTIFDDALKEVTALKLPLKEANSILVSTIFTTRREMLKELITNFLDAVPKLQEQARLLEEQRDKIIEQIDLAQKAELIQAIDKATTRFQTNRKGFKRLKKIINAIFPIPQTT